MQSLVEQKTVSLKRSSLSTRSKLQLRKKTKGRLHLSQITDKARHWETLVDLILKATSIATYTHLHSMDTLGRRSLCAQTEHTL